MRVKYSFGTVFTAACLGMLLFGIVIISLGSILPSVIEKFDLDKIQAGSLAAILPAGILIGSLVFGPIVDRYSYRNLFIVCSILIIAGILVVCGEFHVFNRSTGIELYEEEVP